MLINKSANQQHILVTGGSGYIGSHTVLALLKVGYQVTVVDNLSNSHQSALTRVEKLSNASVNFYQADILDIPSMQNIFESHHFDAVIHFAGLKSVGESVQQPLKYYQNNVQGTINLCQMMDKFGVRKLVFSSSATVYGVPESLPVRESMPTGIPTNAYGQSKLMVEHILSDLHTSNSDWQIAVLRYFNPVGAHESGTIGEDPNGIPDNLMPYISQVACGKLTELNIFGDDYPTPDGTGVRDFIHVLDLAEGHVCALAFLQESTGLTTVNLGTGTGISVKELIQAFEEVNEVSIPFKVASRRAGDLAEVYADASLAKELLGWQAKRTVKDMCQDTWRWQKNNPKGYV